MAPQPKSETIAQYIAACPADVRPILAEIRAVIRAAAPGAVETISYQIPTFKLNGKNLVHFAAWKHHIGFYATPSGHAAFRKELAKYKPAKGSVQFPLAQPMPYALIAEIVRHRVDELQR